MIVILNSVANAGNAQHSYRLALPVGRAVSILNAVPRPAALSSPAARPGRATCFEREARDLADQFEQFRARHAFDATDCHALTVFVDRFESIERARSLGRQLCPRTRTTAVAWLGEPRWRVTLIAYFLEKP